MHGQLMGFRARGLRGLALALALGLLLGTGMPAVLPAYAQEGAFTPEGTPTFTPTATPEIGAQTVEKPAGEPTAEPTPEPDVDATESPALAETPAGEPTYEVPTIEELLDGLEPSFSADGDTAYDLAPVLVIVEDPSPDREVIQIPYEGELPLMRAAASPNITYYSAGEIDKEEASCSTFPQEARSALEYAAAIWANSINSSVPITIKACWASVARPTLGYATGIQMHFIGSSGRPSTLYSTALANALSGRDLKPNDPDMEITFNLNYNWYFGTDAIPSIGTYDLVTVALHEIAHGLNFFGSARIENSALRFGFGDNNYPVIYDHFVEDGNGNKLINYANPSTALNNQLTSNNLWFRGDHSFRANGGSRVKIYAPSPFASGSSFSHLDYATYSSTINNLMVYSINQGTAIHNSGPVAQGLLRDLGWDFLPQSSEPPANPTSLWSPTHQTGVPYEGPQNVVMQWSADAQAGPDSSLAGYSVSWDQNPHGVPDTLADLPPDVFQAESPALANGSWYFHLRACDIYENCAPPDHAGPFIIGTADVVPPGNPTSINSTSHTIGLINTVKNVISMLWSADASDNGGSGVAGYSILWDQSPASIPDDAVDIPVGQLTASSLPLANGDWYFHLKTCDFSGNCAPNAVHRGPYLIRVYPPPVLFEPEFGASPENRRPRFEWSAVEGATYVLQVSVSSSFSTTALQVTTGSAYYQPASDLPRGRTLFWRVRAQGGFGRTAWSQVFSYNSPATPSTPKLRSPAKGALVRNPTPTLRWYASSMMAESFFDYYQVQVATDKDFISLVYAEEISGQSSTSFTPLEDLAPDKLYFWRVRAFNNLGQHSAWSSVWNFRQAMLAPKLLEPEKEASPDHLRPEFAWEEVDGASSYTLQVSRYATGRSPSLSVKVVGTSFKPVKDLPRGVELHWRVRSNGLNGPSLWSERRNFISPATPSTPKLRSPGNGALVRDPQPTLRWYASNMLAGSVFDYYQVQLARDAGFSDLIYEDERVAGQTNTSFKPAVDLAPLTRYFWRVRAFNDLGQYSAWSAVRNFRQAIPPPDLIAPAAEETTANRSPQFSWSPVDGAASYTIQVSRYASFSTRIFAATVYDSTSFTSSMALPANRKLYWRVRTNHAAEFGPSRWSGVRQFYTPPS